MVLITVVLLLVYGLVGALEIEASDCGCEIEEATAYFTDNAPDILALVGTGNSFEADNPSRAWSDDLVCEIVPVLDGYVVRCFCMDAEGNVYQ